ncbi:uncharacterized protein LOC132719216 [Ruditapes philippinarum]|uniref:uncharacterized protein LOC132719216 n=1 Tax=Ruditapes philippinarum TaxID=129788 RepID=UPI00295C0A0B|nr:uncharacterized protein LOC132719216 [Ruditapes philippinarum]
MEDKDDRTGNVMADFERLSIKTRRDENSREEEIALEFNKDAVIIEGKERVNELCNGHVSEVDFGGEGFRFENKSNLETIIESQIDNDTRYDDISCKRITSRTSHLNYPKSNLISKTLNELQHSDVRLESSDLSTNFQLYLLNKFRPNELEEDLGLKGSFLNHYFNYYPNANHSFSTSHPLNSTNNSSCATTHSRDVSMSLSNPEIVRMMCDSESILSFNSSNLSCCSEESDHGPVKIRYDSSTSTSSLSSSSLQNTSSFFRHLNRSDSRFRSYSEQSSCTSEMDEIESPFGTELSSSKREFSDFRSDDSNSCIAEFQHDIDYLAKSQFRTSTPDPKEKDSPIRKTHSHSDSFSLPSGNRFVHGLSPLCRTRSFARGQPTPHNVRRSLVYVSPVRKCATIPDREYFQSSIRTVNHLNMSLPIFDNSRSVSNLATDTSFPKSVFKKDDILPKIMFQDETEEAVYYLETKYLDNSNCKW